MIQSTINPQKSVHQGTLSIFEMADFTNITCNGTEMILGVRDRVFKTAV